MNGTWWTIGRDTSPGSRGGRRSRNQPDYDDVPNPIGHGRPAPAARADQSEEEVTEALPDPPPDAPLEVPLEAPLETPLETPLDAPPDAPPLPDTPPLPDAAPDTAPVPEVAHVFMCLDHVPNYINMDKILPGLMGRDKTRLIVWGDNATRRQTTVLHGYGAVWIQGYPENVASSEADILRLRVRDCECDPRSGAVKVYIIGGKGSDLAAAVQRDTRRMNVPCEDMEWRRPCTDPGVHKLAMWLKFQDKNEILFSKLPKVWRTLNKKPLDPHDYGYTKLSDVFKHALSDIFLYTSGGCVGSDTIALRHGPCRPCQDPNPCQGPNPRQRTVTKKRCWRRRRAREVHQ